MTSALSVLRILVVTVTALLAGPIAAATALSDEIVAAMGAIRAASPSGDPASRRVALVVGVAKYQYAGTLANPVNDAEDMSAALKRIGFEVESVLDPSRSELEAAVRRFGDRSIGAEVSLFHYSGHALEAGGLNWILPATANLNSERDLRFEAIDLDAILEQTDGAARVSLIFLDACRANPFSGRLAAARRDTSSHGLARIEVSATGMLVAFATAPGQVALDGEGRNSPFTAALLHRIETPGLEIKSLFSRITKDVVEATQGKQRPWQNSSLEGDFYLVAPAVAAAALSAPAALNPEVVFWDSIKTSRDSADFKAYLARFSNGLFSELATNRLKMLEQAASLSEQAASPAPPSPAAAAPGGASPLHDRLIARLASISIAPGEAAAQARVYDLASGHKAIAAAIKAHHTWRATQLPSTDAAVTRALESCQYRYQEPCTLLAVEDELQPAPGPATVRDMPRTRYNGRFEPERIPSASVLSPREDIASYRLAAGAKAAAYHPWGRLFVSLGAGSQFEAEERALAQCNDDPGRKGADGPCFLYAVGDGVVLPKRLTKPRPRPQTMSEAFAYLGVPEYSYQYADDKPHKAIAILPESAQTFRWAGQSSAVLAEERALEGCQLQYHAPCVLLASDDTLKAADLWQAARHDMPRLHYDGAYRPEMVALFRGSESEMQSYSSLPAPKAMAIRPSGARVKIATAATPQEAQAKALAACNEGAGALPCFVYAVNDRVIIGQRRTEPLK